MNLEDIIEKLRKEEMTIEEAMNFHQSWKCDIPKLISNL